MPLLERNGSQSVLKILKHGSGRQGTDKRVSELPYPTVSSLREHYRSLVYSTIIAERSFRPEFVGRRMVIYLLKIKMIHMLLPLLY
jgi:hypothetical protein